MNGDTAAPTAVGTNLRSDVGVRLSVVIVSWNTHDLLAQCLESVFGSLTTDDASWVEVLVVDNASADGSGRMVRGRFPQVCLEENPENLGFARASNQAMRHASGRYVLLLNPDTKVLPGALQTLVRFMDEHADAGAAGARMLNSDGTLQPSCFPAPTLSREFWRLFHLDLLRPFGSYRMDRWSAETPREVDIVQGACLILRREALGRVGLLDEDYFIYSEDYDLCYRLRRQGWKVYWVPEASVVHYGGQSTRQQQATMFLRLYEAKILYFSKHYGRLAANAYRLIVLIAALARVLISPLAWFEHPRQRRQHLVLAGHYARLLMALPWF